MTRSIPHGFYSLFVVILALSGWFASLWQGDGCNYALVNGPIVDQLGAYTSTPYTTTIELGFDSYRSIMSNAMSIGEGQEESPTDGAIADEPYADAPGIDPYPPTDLGMVMVPNTTTIDIQQPQEEEQQYIKSRCFDYPEEVTDGIVDSSWTTSRSFAFLGLVVGGGGTTFLICSLCFVFSRVTWRWTGYGLLLAAFCQAISLVTWFGIQLCSWNECGWSRGSVSDALAVAIWALTGGLVLLHYPSTTSEATTTTSVKAVADRNGDQNETEDIEMDLSGKTYPTFDKDEDGDRLRYPHAQIA